MPNRHYLCHSCDFEVEIYQSIKDDILYECPKCSGKLYQNLENIHVSIVGEVKTIGQLAEKNTKKLGKTANEIRLGMEHDAKVQQSRENAKLMSEKTGKTFVSKYDKEPAIKPLDKDTRNKILNADAKKIEKFIVEGNI